MKLGIKATQLVEGGGQKHLEELLKNYPRGVDTEIIVFLSANQQRFDFPARDDITYRYFETPGKSLLRRLIWEQTTLRRHIRNAGIDLLFEPGNVGMFSRKIPRVMLIHNLAPFSSDFISAEPLLSRIRLHLLRFATHVSASRARGVIHLTRYAQSYVNNNLGAYRIPQRVVHMGTDRDGRAILNRKEIQRRFGIKSRFIFSCSHIYRYKNIKELVEAFKLLRDRSDENITLLIAGAPYDTSYVSEIQKLISDNNLNEYVKLLGSVDPEILRSLYATCDLFVFPSTLESASLILLEAMGMGAPIAASDTELCREVLEDAALFFDAANPEAICGCVQDALMDEVLRSVLRRLAWRRSHCFSWKKTARLTDEFIRDVMGANTPAHATSQAVTKRTGLESEVKQVESVRHERNL